MGLVGFSLVWSSLRSRSKNNSRKEEAGGAKCGERLHISSPYPSYLWSINNGGSRMRWKEGDKWYPHHYKLAIGGIHTTQPNPIVLFKQRWSHRQESYKGLLAHDFIWIILTLKTIIKDETFFGLVSKIGSLEPPLSLNYHINPIPSRQITHPLPLYIFLPSTTPTSFIYK